MVGEAGFWQGINRLCIPRVCLLLGCVHCDLVIEALPVFLRLRLGSAKYLTSEEKSGDVTLPFHFHVSGSLYFPFPHPLSVLLDFLSQDEAYIAHCHLKDKCFGLFIVDAVGMFLMTEDISSSVGQTCP